MKDGSGNPRPPRRRWWGDAIPWREILGLTRGLVALAVLALKVDTTPTLHTQAANLVHTVDHVVAKSAALLHVIVSYLAR